MDKFCDLHIHSVFSDGTCKPEEIIDEALKMGLSAVALTDHNTVDGLYDFTSYASDKNIDIAPGVEFSTDYNGVELHILGLFMKQKYFSQVTELMEKLHLEKEKSNIRLIESLRREGIILDYDEMKKLTPKGMINRAHVAEQMMKKGYTSSIKEGFEKYLGVSCGHYKIPKRLTASYTIDFIHSVGAVSVLAHPFLSLNEEGVLRFLNSPDSKGLNGMECYYSTNDDETTAKSLRIAERFSLIPSGGSDFHGERKPDITLGTGKGNLKIPYECYIKLKEKADNH